MPDQISNKASNGDDEPAILVSVAATIGSAPREAGAGMLVTEAEAFGTIGGGRLEYHAITRARALIADPGAVPPKGEKLALGPGLGQCCGGGVALEYARTTEAAGKITLAEAAQAVAVPVRLFGAGHVGRAIAQVFSVFPGDLLWADQRPEQFPKPLPGAARTLIAASEQDLFDAVEEAPAGAVFLVMTHSHALDQELAAHILSREDFAWFGMIGSGSKRRQIVRRLANRGVPAAALARMVCPIGIEGIKAKHPGAIAIAAAAQILQQLEARHGSAEMAPPPLSPPAATGIYHRVV